MRRIILFLFAALAVTSVNAASYEKTDGTIVDPILDIHGNVLSYSGNNLEPWANLEPLANLNYANLSGANLSGANLTGAELTDAYLHYASLIYANLSGANLTGANLTDAELYDANLDSANLDGADLTDANLDNADLTWAGLRNADLSGLDLALITFEWGTTNWTDAFYYTDNEPTAKSKANFNNEKPRSFVFLIPFGAYSQVVCGLEMRCRATGCGFKSRALRFFLSAVLPSHPRMRILAVAFSPRRR